MHTCTHPPYALITVGLLPSNSMSFGRITKYGTEQHTNRAHSGPDRRQCKEEELGLSMQGNTFGPVEGCREVLFHTQVAGVKHGGLGLNVIPHHCECVAD